MTRVFVCLTVDPGQRFAHHVELGLAIPLKNLGITLPQHLGDEVI